MNSYPYPRYTAIKHNTAISLTLEYITHHVPLVQAHSTNNTKIETFILLISSTPSTDVTGATIFYIDYFSLEIYKNENEFITNISPPKEY